MFAPLLAIEMTPRLSCFAAPFKSCSSLNGVPQCDSPPVPVPVGSPVWICQWSNRLVDPMLLRNAYHESRNQSMEENILVLARFRQHQEIVACFWCLGNQQGWSSGGVPKNAGCILTFSQNNSMFKPAPPRLVITRQYARRFPTSFSFPLPLGGLENSSNISSSCEREQAGLSAA